MQKKQKMVRMTLEMEERLQKIADIETEGNYSLLVRKICKEYIERYSKNVNDEAQCK